MATSVNLPVTKVTVMEDRAQVERAGSVDVQGLTRVEATGLSLVAVDRSLKLEVQGATLVDARLERRWKQKPPELPADASELEKRARALEDELVTRNAEVTRLQARRELLTIALQDLLRGIQEGAGAGVARTALWQEQFEALSKQLEAVEETHRAATRASAKVELEYNQVTQAQAQAEQKRSTRECVLALTLEGSGKATVRVSYLVPCAVWRPAYRASLKGADVLLESEAVVWQRTGEEWAGVELFLSTVRPTLGTTPPALAEDRLSTRPKQAIEKKVVDVSLREEVIQSSGEGGGEPELPGLDDGGEARLLQVTGKVSVPSDGQPHRLPLSKFEAKAELERVCAAELTDVISLVARFPNAGGQVLLAGPVDLIRQAGFVGRGQLKFAAPGEVVKLGFGSEDGMRVERTQEEKTDEARLTGRRTTTRKITHRVSNASLTTGKLIIEERVPVSEVKEVEVQVLTKECSPAPLAVSKDGIARIEVDLAPNATRTVKFAWELQAAAKVAGL